MKILVTGGAGFIGSNLVKHLVDQDHDVLVLDLLTYAGNYDSISSEVASGKVKFKKVDIRSIPDLENAFMVFQPNAVMHLAAESHVDRSILSPGEFITTNVIGTYSLLEVTRNYLDGKSKEEKDSFRFHHISTDEVYGDLGAGEYFYESTPYKPSSPYSASKASSDHLVRAWHRTYNIPVLLTNCSNNYGPYQYPEKLIPLVILNALHGVPIPIYGNGKQVRDWLHVQDHVEALLKVLSKGKVGETYNIGGHNEIANIDVVSSICQLLDIETPRSAGLGKYGNLIQFVDDRPGHDTRYAINANKIAKELDWKPRHDFQSGLKQTVQWYLNNQEWWKPLYFR